jgi:hypothetical protein
VPTNKIFGRTPSASGPTPSSTKTVMPRLYLMKGERGNLQFSLSIIISTSISSEFIYLIAEFLFFKKKKKKKNRKNKNHRTQLKKSCNWVHTQKHNSFIISTRAISFFQKKKKKKKRKDNPHWTHRKKGCIWVLTDKIFGRTPSASGLTPSSTEIPFWSPLIWTAEATRLTGKVNRDPLSWTKPKPTSAKPHQHPSPAPKP